MAYREHFAVKKALHELREALARAEQAFKQAEEDGLHVGGFHETTRAYFGLK